MVEYKVGDVVLLQNGYGLTHIPDSMLGRPVKIVQSDNDFVVKCLFKNSNGWGVHQNMWGISRGNIKQRYFTLTERLELIRNA